MELAERDPVDAHNLVIVGAPVRVDPPHTCAVSAVDDRCVRTRGPRFGICPDHLDDIAWPKGGIGKGERKPVAVWVALPASIVRGVRRDRDFVVRGISNNSPDPLFA